MKSKAIYDFTKRIFDIVSATLALILISPLLLVVSIFIKIDSAGPIIYKGRRAGVNGVPFNMLKFRTMVINADTIGGPSTAKNDTRITRVGKVLRKYKIDELPQLINVVLGEMSIVGPRPEVIQYTNLYRGQEKEILSVRPGITDYSSIEFANLQEVLGTNNVDKIFETKIMPKKTELRIKYVRNRSFFEDIKIIIRTFKRLAKK